MADPNPETLHLTVPTVDAVEALAGVLVGLDHTDDYGPFPNGFQYDLPIRGDRGVVTVLQSLLQSARTEEPTT